MERLIIARHGESEASARGVANGDPAAGVGLTAAGEEQARALGRALAAEPLDLCVVSAFPRTRRTAALALEGRAVPVEELAGLGDPRVGRFEGLPLQEYRRWAREADSREEAPGGGESRRAIVARYVEALRGLAARPETTILAVVHALPIAYLLRAREGDPPLPRVDRGIAYAEPHVLTAAELDGALAVLERWREAPTW